MPSPDELEEEAIRGELAKFATDMGATEGITWTDDEGKEIDHIDAAKPVNQTLVHHGDQVSVGDLVLVTHITLGEEAEQGVMELLECWPLEPDDDVWHVKAQTQGIQAKEITFQTRGPEYHYRFSLIERGKEEVRHCCEPMNADLHFVCDQHPDRYDCPDVILHYSEDGRYGIYVPDGGTSWRQIAFCPWCGKKL